MRAAEHALKLLTCRNGRRSAAASKRRLAHVATLFLFPAYKKSSMSRLTSPPSELSKM